MKKNIYSLLLPEALIQLLDEQAQSKNRSRSQIIEEILAAHLALETPQLSVNRLLENVYFQLGQVQTLEMLARNKGNAIQMRTELAYKYSPKVRYILDIKSRRGAFDGMLKIIPRSQSTLFMGQLIRFFDQLNAFEGDQKPDTWMPLSSNIYSFDGSRFMKPIMMREADLHGPGDTAASTMLSAYIQCFHEVLQAYFEQGGMAEKSIKACYMRHGLLKK